VLARNANRNEELSEICRTLKVTAKDLQVPIVALAQLNRGVEIRSEKRPMLADLETRVRSSRRPTSSRFCIATATTIRNSGARSDEFIIAKHRNGPTGR